MYCPYDNDITNQLLNVLPCNMHVVHPWWECYPRLTPRVTFPPRVNNITCYMAEHLTLAAFTLVYVQARSPQVCHTVRLHYQACRYSTHPMRHPGPYCHPLLKPAPDYLALTYQGHQSHSRHIYIYADTNMH